MAQGMNKLKSKGGSLRKEKNRPKKHNIKKGGMLFHNICSLDISD